MAPLAKLPKKYRYEKERDKKFEGQKTVKVKQQQSKRVTVNYIKLQRLHTVTNESMDGVESPFLIYYRQLFQNNENVKA